MDKKQHLKNTLIDIIESDGGLTEREAVALMNVARRILKPFMPAAPPPYTPSPSKHPFYEDVK